MRKILEKMIAVDGKLMYAIQLEKEDKKQPSSLYIRMKDGKVFIDSSNWFFSNAVAFDVSDESHTIAKKIFMTQLQCYVETQIGEIKLLQQVCCDLGVLELFGDSISKSQQLLIANVVKDIVKPRAINKDNPYDSDDELDDFKKIDDNKANA